MLLRIARPHQKQNGSILIMVVVVLSGIGAVTAGLLTILQQQTVTTVEEIRMMRGFGVADSYRLALLEGRDKEKIKSYLELEISQAYSRLIVPDHDGYVGKVIRGDHGWGYKFRYNPDGVKYSGPEGSGRINLDDLQSTLCKRKKVECEINGNSAEITLNPGSRNVYIDTLEIDSKLIFNIEPSSTISISKLIVKGNLEIQVGPGAPSTDFCVTQLLDIDGNIVGENYIKRSNDGCEQKGANVTKSDDTADDDKWTFKMST